MDALKHAQEASRSGALVVGQLPGANRRHFRTLSVTSNKGGVGKTTIAANLAVYLRALREDEPVLIFGFDDQTTLDRIFYLTTPGDVPGARPHPLGALAEPHYGAFVEDDLAAGLRESNLQRVTRFGQYGVDHVPSCRDVPTLRSLLDGPEALQRILLNSKRSGTVVIDTKSDFETLTKSAIQVSDLSIVVVKDQASLIEAKRVFDLLEKSRRPRESARILLSLVDMRVKYREGEEADVLAHLLGEIRRADYPVFETFVSRSPKVESLYTNPEGRALAILQGARQSTVHRQMLQLTHEVVRQLDRLGPEPRPAAAPSDIPGAAVARADSEESARPGHPAGHAPRPNDPEPGPAASEAPQRRGPSLWGGILSRSKT